MLKIKLPVLIGLSFAATYSVSAFALSPPWYILASETQKTLGADPCVRVDDLDSAIGHPGDFDLNIHAICSDQKANALATALPASRDFGGVTVFIRVFDPNGHQEPKGILPIDPAEAAEVYQRALDGNPLFVQIDPGNAIVDFFLEFQPRVVQFYADNLADAYHNLNLVAADAFDKVLDLQAITTPHVGVSTLQECDDVHKSQVARGAGVSETHCERISGAFAYPGFDLPLPKA